MAASDIVLGGGRTDVPVGHGKGVRGQRRFRLQRKFCQAGGGQQNFWTPQTEAIK